MTDEEMRAYIRECVAAQTPTIAAAAATASRAGVEEAFANLGIDIGTPGGIHEWHEKLSMMGFLVFLQKKIGATVIAVVVTVFLGWAGYKLWPSVFPKQGG